jgi:hypothetical protein
MVHARSRGQASLYRWNSDRRHWDVWHNKDNPSWDFDTHEWRWESSEAWRPARPRSHGRGIPNHYKRRNCKIDRIFKLSYTDTWAEPYDTR